MYNALFRLLDHEIGAAVQLAEPGTFFEAIFSKLKEAKTVFWNTVSALHRMDFMLVKLR